MGEDGGINQLSPDIVLWDSHPLQLGATPLQVFVDGIPQLKDPHVSRKAPKSSAGPPSTPDFTREAEQAVKHEGLPPLEPVRRLRLGHKVREDLSSQEDE